MRQIPRLFLGEELGLQKEVEVESGQAHYLLHVLRLEAGAEVHLLDNVTGEWRARLVAARKKTARLLVEEQLHPREEVPDLWLLTAPIRRERFSFIVEKATELGVARILPVETQRTNHERLNYGRLTAHMVEAAEQCERTALPLLDSLQPLSAILAGWEAGRQLVFCDEEGGEPFSMLPLATPAAILVGPEGGFAPEERQAILALPGVQRATLGARVLRADTAVVAAVAQFQVIAAARISR